MSPPDAPSSTNEFTSRSPPPSTPTNYAWPIINLLLRLFTLVFLLVSIIILATDSLTINSDQKLTFKDRYAYRYELSVAVIGMAYTLLQVPFAVIYMGKQFGNIEALRVFSMIGDKVMSLLLATGVGAGFGYTVDSKRDYDELSNIYDQLIDYWRRIDPYDEIVKPVIFDKIDNAADKVYASTGLLLAATVCMVILSVAASFSLIKK